MTQIQQQDRSASTGVPSNAAEARDRVQDLLDERFGPGGGLDALVVADVLLVTSELVTNAIRHGGGLVGFDAEVTADGILLAVSDASEAVPHTTSQVAKWTGNGGFGWPIVGRLAESVEVTPVPGGGKRVQAFMRL